VKLHTLIDLRGPIPTMIAISDGKQADVRVLDDIVPEPGAFYVCGNNFSLRGGEGSIMPDVDRPG
jgi:hypothetical protein